MTTALQLRSAKPEKVEASRTYVESLPWPAGPSSFALKCDFHVRSTCSMARRERSAPIARVTAGLAAVRKRIMPWVGLGLRVWAAAAERRAAAAGAAVRTRWERMLRGARAA